MTSDAPASLPDFRHAPALAEERDFPLRITARGVAHLPHSEATRRAGIVRHELDQAEARYRAAVQAARWVEAHELVSRLRTLRAALCTLEDERRWGRVPEPAA